MSELNRQTLENLRGEIAFRRKLARQHTEGEMLIEDYYGKDEQDAILAQRIETTVTTFEALRSRGVDFSSFVEIGAERGHRSLALASKFGAIGIACDLSLDQLRTAPHFVAQFRQEIPLSRQGDAYVCGASGCRYPVVDDVAILIKPELRSKLYPEFG